MNGHISASPTQGSPAPDRAIFRTRLEEPRLSFLALIAKLTDEEWDSKRTSTHWTVRELLSHIVDGLAHTPEAIEHVGRGKPFLTLPPVLNWLTAAINLLLSKWSALGQTRQTILVRYDAAHQALVTTIEGIHEDEWASGAHCYGDGYKTVLDLCDIPNRHLRSIRHSFSDSKKFLGRRGGPELGNQDSSSFSDSFVPTERNQHVHLTNRAPSPQLRCLEEGI